MTWATWRRTPLLHRSRANSLTCTRPLCPVWTVLWTRGMALESMPAMGIKVCPGPEERGIVEAHVSQRSTSWSMKKTPFTYVCINVTVLNIYQTLADSPLALPRFKCSIQSMSFLHRLIMRVMLQQSGSLKTAPWSYLVSKDGLGCGQGA